MKETYLKKVLVFAVAVLVLAASLCSCTGKSSGSENSSGTASANGGSVKIVTTIFPVYDWVKQIAGSDADIVYLEKSGSDLHNFEPTASDITTLSSADLFIYIGGESDSWVDNALNSVNKTDIVTLSLMDNINAVEEEIKEGMEDAKDDSDGTEYDEHIWLSLRNAEKSVNAITDALCKVDGANAETYKSNADEYTAKLRELDAKYTEMVSGSARKTVLFADRFPFRYFTDDYGIDYYAAFAGCSAESEASFETMSFLIEKTKSLSLPVILVIEGSNKKIADTVRNATGATVLTVNSCQSVPGDEADNITYLSIMESNFEVFREALN